MRGFKKERIVSQQSLGSFSTNFTVLFDRADVDRGSNSRLG